MCMQPDPCELLWLSYEVDLCFKEVGNRNIIEFNADGSYFLLYCDELLHVQQVINICYGKAANFIFCFIPEVRQLRPSRRIESQGQPASLLR